MSPFNIGMLKEWTLRSIKNIEDVYFLGRSTVELDQLRQHVSVMSHKRILVVFFCLLNIDNLLKSQVLQVETEDKQRKLVRFFIDLKSEAVARFFSTEEISTQRFVDMCEELYVLA